jgi:superfamily I DNA/RNA helicase
LASAPSWINPDGSPFDAELNHFEAALNALSNAQRDEYRKRNAEAIARLASERLLIVAGPGSGKSYLFLERIKFWIEQHPEAGIYVASFVRKLVRDLETEVSVKLAEEHQSRVSVSTLHSLARSLVERGGGSPDHHRGAHVSVIPERWQAMVWSDLLEFFAELSPTDYRWADLQAAFYTEAYPTDDSWPQVFECFETLCQFYNAVGFADMIVIARRVVESAPELSIHDLWVVDEYQDLNPAEDHLIKALTDKALGVLLAGDDEQALYQLLKQSLPEIIVSYYGEASFANAMLPFCSRCSYYVCLAASAFIAQG